MDTFFHVNKYGQKQVVHEYHYYNKKELYQAIIHLLEEALVNGLGDLHHDDGKEVKIIDYYDIIEEIPETNWMEKI